MNRLDKQNLTGIEQNKNETKKAARFSERAVSTVANVKDIAREKADAVKDSAVQVARNAHNVLKIFLEKRKG